MKRETADRQLPRRASQHRKSGFGEAVLESLRGWERGEPLTVRHVEEIKHPRRYSSAGVRRLRLRVLGVSQAVFARLLGVSVKLVEAWEAGRNQPAAPVLRLFELIEAEPQAFLRRYVRGAA